MKGKGSAGWLILIAALAVPGLVFFNWWSKQSAANKAELEKKVRNRGVAVFGGATDKKRLDNPLDKPATPPPAQQPAVAATAGSTTAGVSPSTATAAAAPSADVAPGLPAKDQNALTPPSAPAAAATASVAVSTDPALFALARDPTLSPYDMVRIEQIALEKEQRERELRAGTHVRIRKTHIIERPVENDIDLQGIVSTDQGDKAIINGEMVGEGELVKGAKVVKITSQTVVFMYHGRRFSKTITK